MEVFAGLAVVIVLCIILGISADSIMFMSMIGAFGLILLFIAALAVAFGIFLVLLLTSSKKDAVMCGIEKKEKSKFSKAIYNIDGTEYPCFFPAEPSMMYKPGKTCRVFLNKRCHQVFDKYSIITCVCGEIFSIVFIAAIIMVIRWLTL